VFLFAVGLWTIRDRVAGKVVGAEERSARNSLLLGAGIMAVELPTALPYFAVIAAIIANDGSTATQIFLLLLFNGVFAAPLLLILVIRSVAGQRGVDALTAFRLQLNRRAAVIIPAVALAVAAALLLLGGIGLSMET
jgi:cytochrome c biogenesis protein CcdA